MTAIADPGPEVLRAATQGDLRALDLLLSTLQPGIFRLATRVLGHRDDAADATQEILLKIVTHLGAFRGASAFTTWVWKVAHNHLLTARTRLAESPEVSLEGIAEKLGAGLEFAAQVAREQGEPGPLTPQDKLEARQVALACTQSMLMALDREQRLVYLLDTVFDLPSREAAEVVGITPEAYRQRLSRTRARLHAFMGDHCGLVSTEAACRCDRQLPAVRATRGRDGVIPIRAETAPTATAATPSVPSRHDAERQFDAFERVTDAAQVFRHHPDTQAPDAMRAAIRAVLVQEGFLQRDRPQ